MRKVLVIGGSAGGIPALCTILSFPPNLDAAVLAVIHTTPESQHMADVLRRCDHLPVVRADKAQLLAAGTVYVAAPNRHLIVRDHCVLSRLGPRENRHRPSVNAFDKARWTT